jgi:hypothetical protein
MTAEEIITLVLAGLSKGGLCAACQLPVASKGMCRAHYQKAYRWLVENGMEIERSYEFKLVTANRTPAAEAKANLWSAIKDGEPVGN